MKNRFSSWELFELRNNIPVNMLIWGHLQIPSKIRDGFFRFLCPLCNEFQTAVNPATKLARCFRCEKKLQHHRPFHGNQGIGVQGHCFAFKAASKYGTSGFCSYMYYVLFKYFGYLNNGESKNLK